MSRPTTMKVDGTVYWAIFTYTDAGVLVDADSTPTVAVRKNGSATGDAVTITKRAATTGIYDCSHAPAGEVEGDCFAYEETATLSAQAYLNSWELEVFAAERGTDSALLAADKPTNFDLLAVNGSGEVTTSNPASGGGSAHTAADVAALILSTPTTPLTNDATGALSHVLLTDVTTTNTDMRGTDSANTVAPDNASIAAILVDTADLQANQGQWLTATTTVSSNMRGTDGANTVTPNTIAPVDVSASVALILADTNELQGNQGDWATATTTVSSNMRGTDNANTVAPVDVSADVALILADTADLQANQGQWLTATTTVSSNMRGTDGANTIAPVDVSANVALILEDTSDLQSNQGQWLTATGFSTFDPASDTVAHVTLVDTTTDLTNGGSGGGSCPTAQEIVDAWGNQDQSVYVTQGTLGYYLDAQVSTAGSGGTGLYQTTVRIEDSSNNSLQGARVNVDGTTLTLTTGTSGEVTFNLDSGVYLIEVSPPAGYGTPIGQVVTVSGADPADTTFTLTDGCGTVPWIG